MIGGNNMGVLSMSRNKSTNENKNTPKKESENGQDQDGNRQTSGKSYGVAE